VLSARRPLAARGKACTNVTIRLGVGASTLQRVEVGLALPPDPGRSLVCSVSRDVLARRGVSGLQRPAADVVNICRFSDQIFTSSSARPVPAAGDLDRNGQHVTQPARNHARPRFFVTADSPYLLLVPQLLSFRVGPAGVVSTHPIRKRQETLGESDIDRLSRFHEPFGSLERNRLQMSVAFILSEA